MVVWLALGSLAPTAAAEPPAKKGKGANKHWAYLPVKRPAIPVVRDRSWVRNPVDAFVLALLEKSHLKPAPPAEPRTLLRRVFLDLIGLPPTPEEVAAFLKDPSPLAYERVVDGLLSRPQYGERWGRHWLDVARYAETNGYERDGAKPHAWRFRDYVISSLNRDKPYDRFITEQIAGDEIAESNAETQIATTFLRLGTWDDEPAEPRVDRYDQLDDVLGTTTAAFLGITLRCARCHDHKFDPFTQKDYYRMLAVFEPLKRPQKQRADLDRLVGAEKELAAYRKALAGTTGPEPQLEALKAAIRSRLFGAAAGRNRRTEAKRTKLPAEAVAAFQTSADERTTRQKELVKQFALRLDQEIRQAATAEEKSRLEMWEKQVTALRPLRPAEPPRAYIWYEDAPTARVTHVFRRGDPNRPLDAVGPGVPGVLVQRQPDPPRPLARSTGRRLWLARWLTHPDNPLVARVMVNRIWQEHFGRGIVATANDLGVMSEVPSHPDLLDWLAAEFMARGWSMKALHRLIILSNTYRMSATDDPAAAREDSEVQLLWRWRQRRLEAEAVRDSVLAVSGQLNRQMAGPSIYPKLPRTVLEGQSRPGDGWGKSEERQASRRSVYIFVKRVLAVPELELLDAPDTTSSCEQRMVSTTAPQALTFLNGGFLYQQAGYFAARLRREAGGEAKTQVRRAFELALGRPPTAEEVRLSLDFLTAQEKQIVADALRSGSQVGGQKEQALAGFCLVLLNTNEFVYLN
jgi:hypothetical protein